MNKNAEVILAELKSLRSEVVTVRKMSDKNQRGQLINGRRKLNRMQNSLEKRLDKVEEKLRSMDREIYKLRIDSTSPKNKIHSQPPNLQPSANIAGPMIGKRPATQVSLEMINHKSTKR